MFIMGSSKQDKMNKTKRKRRIGSDPDNEQEVDGGSAKKVKGHAFSLLDKLRRKDAFECLRSLESSKPMESWDEMVLEFIEQGGGAADLLTPMNSQTKLKSPEVTVLFGVYEQFLACLSRLLHRRSEKETRAECSRIQHLAFELSKMLLEDHIRYLILLMSPSNTAEQTKASLSLITAMVNSGAAVAKEVLLKLDFEHDHIQSLAARHKSETIRQAYVRFFLSFLLYDNVASLMQLFADKCRLSLTAIFQSIVNDTPDMICLLLTTFKRKFIENGLVSKTAKMKIFGVTALSPMLAMLTRQQLDPDQRQPDDGVVTDFILALLTSHKNGIVFFDLSCGTSGKNNNHLLQNCLRSLDKPWAHPHLSEIVTRSLAANPDQFKPYVQKVLQPVWTPRKSENWLQVTDLLIGILKGIDLSHLFQTTAASKTGSLLKFSLSVIRNIFTSEQLFKEVVVPSLANLCEDSSDDKVLVARRAVALLSLIFAKLESLAALSCFKCIRLLDAVLTKLKDCLPPIGNVIAYLKAEPDLAGFSDGVQTLRFWATHLDTLPTASDIKVLTEVAETRFEGHPELDRMTLVQLNLIQLQLDNGEREAARGSLKTVLRVALRSGPHRPFAIAVLKRQLSLSQDQLDLLLPWLFMVPEQSCKRICSELSRTLRAQPQGDVIMRLVKNDRLSEQFEDYYNACLMTVICLQDDPDTFISALDQPELAKARFSGFLKRGPHQLQCDQPDFEHLITAWRLLRAKPDQLLPFLTALEDQRHRIDIVVKILSKSAVQSTFDPFSAGTKAGLYLELLHISSTPGHDSDQAEALMVTYAELYISAVRRLLSSPEARRRSAESHAVQVAGRVLTLSASQAATIVDAMSDSDTARPDQVATTPILRRILAELLLSARRRCLALDLDGSRSLYLVRICQALLDSATRHSVDDGLLVAVAEYAAADFQLRRDLLEQLVEASCASKHPQARGFLLQLMSRASFLPLGFVKWAQTHPKLIMKQLAEFLPCLQAAFSHSEEPCLEELMKKVGLPAVRHVLTSDMERPDEAMVSFIGLLANKLPAELVKEAMPPVERAGASVEWCQVMLHLAGAAVRADAKHSGLGGEELVLHLVRVLPDKLKDSVDSSLADRLSQMCIKCLALVPADQELRIDPDVWQRLVRGCLKHGLKWGLTSCLRLLTRLCETQAARGRLAEDAEQIYQMVVGHSQFVDLLLGSDRLGLKEEVLRLLMTLLLIRGAAVSSEQLPLFLAAYSGTLSRIDVLLLNIIYLHDFRTDDPKSGGGSAAAPLQAFRPLVWGEAALSRFAFQRVARPGVAKNHLSKVPKTSEILALIDPDKMLNSALNFPIRLSLDEWSGVVSPVDELYDPRFFLPLLCQLCATENYVDRHLMLMERGVLALAVGSLSSLNGLMRKAGVTLLSRLFSQLEAARKGLSAEKQIWLHLIGVIRNSLAETYAVDNDQVPRMPCILSVFLIRICCVLQSPMDPMYKTISHFILAKPKLNVYAAPEFLRLFHSKDPLKHNLERTWILDVLRDGMRDHLSYAVCQQHYVYKMVMAFHDSCLSGFDGPDDTKGHRFTAARRSVLDLILQACQLSRPAFDLVKNRSLLVWVASQLSGPHVSKSAPLLIEIVVASWHSIAPARRRLLLSDFTLTLTRLWPILNQCCHRVSWSRLLNLSLQVLSFAGQSVSLTEHHVRTLSQLRTQIHLLPVATEDKAALLLDLDQLCSFLTTGKDVAAIQS